MVYIIRSVRGGTCVRRRHIPPQRDFWLIHENVWRQREISSQRPDDGQTQHWRLFSHELCVHFNHDSDTSWAVEPPPSADRWKKGMKAKPETNDIRAKPRHASLKTSQKSMLCWIIAPYGTHLAFRSEKRHISTNSSSSTYFRRKYRRVVRLYLRIWSICLSELMTKDHFIQ